VRYPFDSFLYSLKHLLDFRAAVAYPSNGLLYRSAFDACLLRSIADFMFLPAGNQFSVTAATAAAPFCASCHFELLPRE
jgi:hypothetical protein